MPATKSPEFLWGTCFPPGLFQEGGPRPGRRASCPSRCSPPGRGGPQASTEPALLVIREETKPPGPTEG
jgi:hypothetical protein